MSLGERIKECRQKCGMSQEKVAELVGVSRQAVTKWESGQSAPNTENLFKLAEIFGTTVDLLLSSESEQHSPAEQIYYLYKMEQEQQRAAFLRRIKHNVWMMLAVAAIYLLFYLAGRLIWCDFSQMTVLGWLFEARPSGKGSYLYGWLLSSDMFWLALGFSMATALVGCYRIALTSSSFFVAGWLIGMWLGPNPAGSALGHGHYGWAYWAAIFLISLPLGIVWQRAHKRGVTALSPTGKKLIALSLASIIIMTLIVKILTI